jgi:hypothetical protein
MTDTMIEISKAQYDELKQLAGVTLRRREKATLRRKLDRSKRKALNALAEAHPDQFQRLVNYYMEQENS